MKIKCGGADMIKIGIHPLLARGFGYEVEGLGPGIMGMTRKLLHQDK